MKAHEQFLQSTAQETSKIATARNYGGSRQSMRKIEAPNMGGGRDAIFLKSSAAAYDVTLTNQP